MLDSASRKYLDEYQQDWPKFAREILGVRLDKEQEEIVHSVQVNPRTVVKSGHARGKDFVASVCGTCFLFLNYPSKVIATGPTGRQVQLIMLSEVEMRWRNARVPLGGEFLADRLRLAPDWFLVGFKARDNATESWTGFHSPNILVVVTEASGIGQSTFDAIEGLLTGNSRLLLVLNPNVAMGETFNAFRSKLYKGFTLSCLDAPNVVAKKTLIPGQVNWSWVNTVLQKPGWVQEITEEMVCKEEGDFQWDYCDGRGPVWLRPSDLARVKVLGLFPKEPPDALIPISWVIAAQDRWRERKPLVIPGKLRLGSDVAGMGNDTTCLCPRYEDYVHKLLVYAKADHMVTAGRILNLIKNHYQDIGLIDTIGEGAGVYSRLKEQGKNVISAKFSHSAEGLTDVTGEHAFINMRAYCYWALRDALDPRNGSTMALPADDMELMEELTSIKFSANSQNKIVIEKKEDIQKRLGRSPDRADSLALTYYPVSNDANMAEGGWDVSPE